jgi:hypothetical protein
MAQNYKKSMSVSIFFNPRHLRAGKVSLQQFPVFHILQYAHLPDDDFVQLILHTG